ncbi:hypothetical protein [Aeromicrobium fastidiosum]|uniref:Uncharacterized protein n=1 Tax=Aeromicrobium fastidiosum TaxID=52699 RepID=A0A641AI22_9ACTN|nr:hypothetical protein [Aeromicrobium fastidiosum]KAA1373762.1 hypothetical protein ESP62_017590 [Aeromicrobium fastidiosum]MBP2391331.1 hypothetical protein [Aeromicrobium fastidiosum]
MRTRSGWALSVLGVLIALAGAAVMVVLGPDSRMTTGPHAIETDDIAVVTAPKVIRWADVQVDVLAEVPVRKPVFIGIGNAVDVQDYVSKTQRLEITSFTRPWSISSRSVEGQPNLPGAPTAIDWWIDSAAGLGGASISTRLPDETVSIAILSVGSSNLSGLEVTLAYGVKGGFSRGLAAVLMGLAVVWIGVLVRRGTWPAVVVDEDEDDDEAYDDPDGQDVEEVEEVVVYVYVDDDGVEHELTAEEAAELELDDEVVVEVVEEVSGIGADVAAKDEDAALPTVPQVTVPGVPTAADIAAGLDEPGIDKLVPGASRETDTEPEGVVYVYVDDDGVEHEISEEELAEFEVVDDDEEDRS